MGFVNWLGLGGGVEARHRRSVDLEGSGGMLQNFFFINLIEYGVSFCILKYKSLSLYLCNRCAGGTRWLDVGGGGVTGGVATRTPNRGRRVLTSGVVTRTPNRGRRVLTSGVVTREPNRGRRVLTR